MKRLRVLLPVLALPILVLAGCDDGTSSGGDLGDFDPAAVVAAVDQLVRPIQATAPTNAIINLERAYPSLSGLGVVLPDEPGSPGVQIPDELLGTTLAYDPAEGAWVPDDTRTGAPADALRVLWYVLDGAGNIQTPLTEQGYMDLTEAGLAVGIQQGLGASAVETLGGGTATVLELVQGYEATQGATETVRFGGAGAYDDGASEVDFSFLSEVVRDTLAGGEEESLNVVLSDATTYYEVEASGSVNGATGAVLDQVTETIMVDGVTTVVDVTISSTGGGEQLVETEGSVRHAGALVATISTTENGQLIFADADGQELTGTARSAIQALYGSLQYGLYVIETLPLYFR